MPTSTPPGLWLRWMINTEASARSARAKVVKLRRARGFLKMVFGVFKLCLHGQCNVPQDPSGPSRTLPNKKHGVDKNVLNRHSGVRAQEIWNAQNGPSPIPRPAVESVRHPPWKVFGTRRGKCSAVQKHLRFSLFLQSL